MELAEQSGRCAVCSGQCAAGATDGFCIHRMLEMALGTPPADADTATEAVAPAAPPQPFGAYLLVEEIGRGGNGVVYRAWQPQLRRMVALKMLAGERIENPDARRRFQREAELIAALDHPHILPVYAAGECDGTPYFTAKLATGGSLADCIRGYRGRPAAIAQLVAILARAIQYAHGRGVLHRDLKPSNVVFDGTGRCLIADFGLARTLDRDSALTGLDELIGTPRYSAPELLSATMPVTTAADVYGLGTILYELLTGQPPFAELTPLQLLRQTATRRPRPPRTLDARIDSNLATICMRCLERQPRDRFASAGVLAQALDGWHQAGWRSRLPHALRRLALPSRRRLWVRWSLALAGTLASAALLAAATHGAFSSAPDPARAATAVMVLPAFPERASAADRMAVMRLTAALRAAHVAPVNAHLRRIGRANDTAAASRTRRVRLGAFTQVRVSTARDRSTPMLHVDAIDVLRGERIWQSNAAPDALGPLAQELARVLTARQQMRTQESQLPRAALAALMRGRELYGRAESASNDAAIAAYQRAIALAPDFALTHALLSFAYAQRSNRFGGAAFWNDSAIEAAERAARLDPSLGAASAALGYAYYNKGWWQRATAAYIHARDLGLIGVGGNLALIQYGTGHFDAAFNLYRERVAHDPANDAALYLGAQTLFTVGAIDAGERWMRAAIALEPHAGKRQLMEAEIASYRGDYDRCRQLAGALDADLVSGGFGAAGDIARGCTERLHDWQSALTMLDHTKRRYAGGTGDLGNAGPALEEAILLQQLGHAAQAGTILAAAQRAAQAGIDSEREYPKIWLRMAAVRRLQGDVDGAYQALDHAFAQGLTINHRNADDFEFLPFAADARFVALREASMANMAAMRVRIESSASLPRDAAQPSGAEN